MPVRALVMSGGGAKGAFEVGAVETLVAEQGLDFQVIAGVSAGALNAILLAQGSGPEGLRQRLDELKRIWLGIRSERDVYRRRFLGKVLALVLNDSMLDPEPLRALIRRHANPQALRTSGREFRIGVSWLENGLYECIDQHHPNVVECTVASGSMPVAFPPVRVGDRTGVDGGVRNVTPLENAFRALRERNGHPAAEAAEMYVVLASPLTVVPERGPWKTALQIGQRSVAMLVNEVFREDLLSALVINEAVRGYLELRARLESELGPPRAQRLLDGIEFPFTPPKFQWVRVRAVVPDREFSDALQFEPERIRDAYEAGRVAARQPLEAAELMALLRDAAGREEAKAA